MLAANLDFIEKEVYKMAELKIDLSKVVEGAIKEFKHQGYNVTKWISVDEKLPEDTKTVLVWYTSNTLFGLSEGYGLSWYSPTAKWYKNELNGENIAVLYWQPLSEPPKED